MVFQSEPIDIAGPYVAASQARIHSCAPASHWRRRRRSAGAAWGCAVRQPRQRSSAVATHPRHCCTNGRRHLRLFCYRFIMAQPTMCRLVRLVTMRHERKLARQGSSAARTCHSDSQVQVFLGGRGSRAQPRAGAGPSGRPAARGALRQCRGAGSAMRGVAARCTQELCRAALQRNMPGPQLKIEQSSAAAAGAAPQPRRDAVGFCPALRCRGAVAWAQRCRAAGGPGDAGGHRTSLAGAQEGLERSSKDEATPLA